MIGALDVDAEEGELFDQHRELARYIRLAERLEGQRRVALFMSLSSNRRTFSAAIRPKR